MGSSATSNVQRAMTWHGMGWEFSRIKLKLGTVLSRWCPPVVPVWAGKSGQRSTRHRLFLRGSFRFVSFRFVSCCVFPSATAGSVVCP